MATIEKPPAAELALDRFLLRGISWELYEQLREIRENWGVRMTYETSWIRSFRAWVRQAFPAAEG